MVSNSHKMEFLSLTTTSTQILQTKIYARSRKKKPHSKRKEARKS